MPFQRTKIPGPNGKLLDGQLIPIQNQHETPATYLLADGTALTLRTVLVRVVRIDGQYDPSGNPAYVTQTQVIASADAPEALKRLPGTEGEDPTS